MTRSLCVLGVVVALTSGAHAEPPTNPPPTPAEASPSAKPALRGQGPSTVSTSAGEVGGVVVLWPRIVPNSDAEPIQRVAGELQQKLHALVGRALPGKPVDVRPKPERSCPQKGCDGIAVGLVLAHSEGGGCVATVTVARPGIQPSTLVMWAGKATVEPASVPFRQPPESSLTIVDYEPCEALLGEGKPLMNYAVETALQAVNRAP